MNIYGIKIDSDIELGYEFASDTEYRYTLALGSNPPQDIIEQITCGFRLYRAHGRKVYLYTNQEFDSYNPNQPFCYEVEDIVRFYWLGGEGKIYYEFISQIDNHLLGFWFTHLMLPFYIALEGMYDIFHGGCVEVEGKPIVFVAPSMGGKSTMTDFFIKQHHTLISDDKVCTFIQDDRFMTVGSHPYHRPYRKFEDLGYRVDNYLQSFKPIEAFYILQRSDSDAEIVISEIRGFHKFDSLLPHYLFTFPWNKLQRIKYLSRINNSIRVFSITVPWDMDRLPQVHQAITTHTKSLSKGKKI